VGHGRTSYYVEEAKAGIVSLLFPLGKAVLRSSHGTQFCGGWSIDLDPLRCYYGIHGLGDVTRGARRRGFAGRRALPRFREVLARPRHSRRRFLRRSARTSSRRGAQRFGAELTRLSAAGHESSATTSHTHPYEAGRGSTSVRIEDEIATGRGTRFNEIATGAPIVGFRAPGYDLSAPLLRVLERRGYRYDSSVFPSWPYYLAKAGRDGA